MVARLVKYAFTGDLNAELNSCPPFPGKERHYLRAQLARIEHSTELCPNGTYVADEEDPDGKLFKLNPDPVESGTDALKDFANWTHASSMILSNGRTSFLPVPEDPEDPEKSAAIVAGQEAEQVAMYRAVAEEEGFDQFWTSRVCGDVQVYKGKGEGAADSSYAVNVIRSLRWPGAVTVAKGGSYCCIYIGDGMKKGDSSFNPIEPPEVQSDPFSLKENPEPTPQEAPEDPPEPDTDAEVK